jgi:flagellin-specific chaperone FliS
LVHQQYSKQVYRQQDLAGASPIRLVVMAYDLAISACHQGDFIRATQAISVLRDALNFDYPEASVGLFRLYQWCLDCIRSGEFDSAVYALTELRNAWVVAEKKLEDQTTQKRAENPVPIPPAVRRPIASA